MSIHDSIKELMEELSIVQIQANTYEKNYKEAVEEIARLKMKISAADGGDWEKKYKHLLYEVIPRMSAQEELYIEAIKKLISERDQAIADLRLMFKEGECAICPYNEGDCLAYDVDCKWRGVQNGSDRQK